jgi:hypothetical protein
VPDEGFSRAGRTRPGPRVHGARYGPPPGGARCEDSSSRRPRWDIDAGITERDVAALFWLGQQYAARSDVLRVLQPLAVRAGAAPRGRQEPRPRRRHRAARRPDLTAGSGLYGEDVDPLPKRVAVEVELTRKGAARLQEAWTRPRLGRWTRTVYDAPPEVAGYLSGQLQRIRPRHPIQVHPLLEVPGTSYQCFTRHGGVS